MTERQQKNIENNTAQNELEVDNAGLSSEDQEKEGEQNIEQMQQNHEAEVKDLNDKLLRLVAEIENLRKRNEQQTSDLKKYAISGFAKEIITVLENFQLIIDNAPHEILSKDKNLQDFYQGIELTHKNLTKVFEQNGIVRIYPVGEKFDHNFHQVVKQIESEEESGTIIQVMQAGYVLNDRLLKEAMVVIAK